MAWGKYLKYMDRLKTDKKKENTILWYIVTGSILNIIFITMIYNFSKNSLFTLTGFGYGFYHFILVASIKEFSKFIVFFFMIHIFNSIKHQHDGIIQAVSISLGFALIENYLLSMDYGLGNLLMRSVISITGHITLAAFWGYAWTSLMYTSDTVKRTANRYNASYRKYSIKEYR